MRISDWSSDVCSSDLPAPGIPRIRSHRDEGTELQVKITLNIWRQANASTKGAMQKYDLDNVSEDMSFLEMLDLLNENLNELGQDPVAFDSDCREGICGTCSLMINAQPHGPEVPTTDRKRTRLNSRH